MNEAVGAIAEETPHWFAIPGEQDGRRTLGEQMLGLESALASCDGRSVLDMGCAEGMIALEFARAGAHVYAVDYKQDMIDTAKRVAAGQRRLAFEAVDLRNVIRKARLAGKWRTFDIVLALAVLHKLDDPKAATEFVAESCKDLAIIRLPIHAPDGIIRAKHGGRAADVRRIMAAHGFRLEKTAEGPRREPVQHWRA